MAQRSTFSKRLLRQRQQHQHGSGDTSGNSKRPERQLPPWELLRRPAMHSRFGKTSAEAANRQKQQAPEAAAAAAASAAQSSHLRPQTHVTSWHCIFSFPLQAVLLPPPLPLEQVLRLVKIAVTCCLRPVWCSQLMHRVMACFIDLPSHNHGWFTASSHSNR